MYLGRIPQGSRFVSVGAAQSRTGRAK